MLRDGMLKPVLTAIRECAGDAQSFACGALYNLSRAAPYSREARQHFIDADVASVFSTMVAHAGKPSLYAVLISGYLNTTKSIRLGVSVLSDPVQNARIVDCLHCSIAGDGYMDGVWSVLEILGAVDTLLVTSGNRDSLYTAGLVPTLAHVLGSESRGKRMAAADRSEELVYCTSCIAKLSYLPLAREKMIELNIVQLLSTMRDQLNSSGLDAVSSGSKDERSIRTAIVSALFSLDPSRSDELREAFAATLEAGSKPWMRSKIMLVGQGRSGKTAFLNAMQRKEFSQTASTIGIDTMTMEVTSLKSGREWWDVYDDSKGELERAQAELTAAVLTGNLNKGDGSVMDFLMDGDMIDTVDDSGSSSAESTIQSSNANDSLHERLEASPEAIDAGVSKLDRGLLLESMNDKDDDDGTVILEAWDYGGQEVFYNLHHLFLTRFGVYCILFNMKWLAPDAPDAERDEALGFLRFWLNSVAVHTRDKDGTCAPVILVGTHKDVVSDPGVHESISRLLHEKFHTNPAFPYATRDESGEGRDGRAVLCFFPVDNTKGHSDPAVIRVMTLLQKTVMAEDYIRQQVPFVWLKVYDQLQKDKRRSLTFGEIVSIAKQAGLPASTSLTIHKETEVMLKFYHQLGVLMWHAEPALRDAVVLDPAQYLVAPATKVICEHEIHCPPEHKAARKLRSEWSMLAVGARLDKRLLSALWASQPPETHDPLCALLALYGLFIPVHDEKGGSDGKRRELYLVPALLKPKPNSFKPPPCRLECTFAFSVDDLDVSDGAAGVDINRLKLGFLPNGIFSRLIGKVVMRQQHTGGMPPQLSKHHVTTSFGAAKFTMIEDTECNAVRLYLDVGNPLGIVTIFEEMVQEVLDETIPQLRVRLLLPWADGHFWVPRDLLIKSVRNFSSIWIGEEQIMPVALKEALGSWLPSFGELPSYDVFFSYRHGDNKRARHDGKFLSKLVDAVSHFTVGKDLRRVEVFHDAIRLEAGQSWLEGFCSALVTSTGAVPLVSADALKRMKTLTPDSPCDNVLLEWILMLELHACGKLKFIYPLLIGSRQDSRPLLGDFFAEGHVEALPDVVVPSVIRKATEVLAKHRAPKSLSLESRTVRGIVKGILEHLGLNVREFWASHGHDVAQHSGHTTLKCDETHCELCGLHQWVARKVVERVHESLEESAKKTISRKESQRRRDELDKTVLERKTHIRESTADGPAVLDQDAAVFWKENFPTYKEVEWYLFSYALAEEFGDLTVAHLNAIKEKVDINKDGKVHELEFNMMTKKRGFRGAIAFAAPDAQIATRPVDPSVENFPPFYDIVRQGVLLKRADGKTSRWKLRRLILSSTHLTWYDSEDGKGIKGCIRCNEIQDVILDEATEGQFSVLPSMDVKPFVFNVPPDTEGKSSVVDIRNEWRDAILSQITSDRAD